MDSSNVNDVFNTESKKLEQLLSQATNPDLSISEIVNTYYQIINVSSLCMMLKQTINENHQADLEQKIIKIENLISEKFNSKMHPQIIENLTKSIKQITSELQSNNSEQKSKKDIERQAKLYEELRQKMSTKEFVEQYDKGLK